MTEDRKLEIIRRGVSLAKHDARPWPTHLRDHNRRVAHFAENAVGNADERILLPEVREVVGLLAASGYDKLHDEAHAWLRSTEESAHRAQNEGPELLANELVDWLYSEADTWDRTANDEARRNDSAAQWMRDQAAKRRAWARAVEALTRAGKKKER